MRRIVLTVLLAFQASTVLAQRSTVDLIADELQQAFPDSITISSTYTPNTIHQIALGVVQRAAPESMRRVAGALTKTLYEIPQTYSGDDVFLFFQTLFNEKSFERLFGCSGRSCGSSNDWANYVFKNRILYGPVQNQFYLAYQESEDSRVAPYISVYIITRGNRRLYAYVEVTEPRQSSSNLAVGYKNSLARDVIENGFGTLKNIQFQSDEALVGSQLSALIAVMNENPLLEVYVVSHLTGDVNLEALQSRSQKRAETIVSRLVEAGISPARVSSHGIGPLAPNCITEACRDRVDVVRR
ncbi:MAG: outer membrane protein OmpA-like peptidoglycan-associated protein [Pseudohongiellaceae bacterium]|jgi:outer membrane protein OmpA-like peptidoglycan-associated protein